jgi:predicted lipoprotein
MYNKVLKYIVAIVALIIVLANSVYFKDLDEVKAAALSGQFDAAAYAKGFWDNKLMPNLNSAIDLNKLVPLLKMSPDETFEKYSNALGIGNIRFFLVKGEGKIISINENDMSVLVKSDSTQNVIKLATEYIYGNAVRDAPKAVFINDFDNTMDFNNVSAEINKIIRSEVLPPFMTQAKEQGMINFFGAIELNKTHLNLDSIEVIPVSLKVFDKRSDETP